jgi:hypothetical protein
MHVAASDSPLKIGRSLAAVLAGALTGIALSVGTDLLLHAAGLMPAPGQPAAASLLVAATIYRTIYGVLGAYLTAWIAPYRPIAHVMTLGALGLLANLIGTISTWNKGPAYGPHWYPVALIVLAVPTAWLGGKLRLMQRTG